MIAEHGRMAWRKANGYGERSHGEARIGRYKEIFGPALHSRKTEARTTETAIAVRSLNRMTCLGRAIYQRAF